MPSASRMEKPKPGRPASDDWLMGGLRVACSVRERAIANIGDYGECGDGHHDLAQAFRDEMPDWLSVAAQQPGKEEETRSARHDRRNDEQAEIDLGNAGKNGDDLDRRQMRETRSHQQQQHGFVVYIA